MSEKKKVDNGIQEEGDVEMSINEGIYDGEGKGDILILTLGDPFLFDGVEVTEINMEGLMSLTASDLCAIDVQMIAKGYSGVRMEVTKQYALLVAARINKRPWEFCNLMKARDVIRLRDMVTAFFYARG